MTIEQVSSQYVGHDEDYTYITFGAAAKAADHLEYMRSVYIGLRVGTSSSTEAGEDKFRVQNLTARMTANSSRPAANESSVFSNEIFAEASGTIGIKITERNTTISQLRDILKYGIRVFNRKNGKKWYIKSAFVEIEWGEQFFPEINMWTSWLYRSKENTFEWGYYSDDTTIPIVKQEFVYEDSASKKTVSLAANVRSYKLGYADCSGSNARYVVYTVHKTAQRTVKHSGFYDKPTADIDNYMPIRLDYENPVLLFPTEETSVIYGTGTTLKASIKEAADFVKTIKCQMWDKNGTTQAKYASTVGTLANGIILPTAEYTATTDGMKARVVVEYLDGKKVYSDWALYTFVYDKPTAYPSNGTSLVHCGIYNFNWLELPGLSKIVLRHNNYADTGTASTLTLSKTAKSYSMDTSKFSDKTGLSWSLTFTYANGYTTTTGTIKNPFNAPNVSVNDLRPSSGNAFRGFDTGFSWAININKPSNVSNVICTGINCEIANAVFRWQKQNDTVNHDTTITGPAKSFTVNDKVMTVGGTVYTGAFRWCVVVTTKLGYTYTSNWASLTYFEIPITIKNLLPATGSRAVKALQNQFAWVFEASGNYTPPKPISQKYAVLFWRYTGETSWQSIAITGTVSSYTFAAGKFIQDEIQWYVEVTANTGTKATSEVQTVSTLDDVSFPACVAPSGEFKDASKAITFSWKHIISTGTEQTSAVLEYSTDSGISYKTLATVSGSANSTVLTANTLKSGTIYWRVKTANSDGNYSAYSAVAIFVASKDPDAPSITYTSGASPLPVIRWQSSEQVGFDLMIDGQMAGTYYGTDKVWQSRQIFADGEHVVSIRILDRYDKRSGWASIMLPVENSYDEESEKVNMSVIRQFGQVRAEYQTFGEYVRVYLLRDGQLIAKGDEEGDAIIDRGCVGWHSYKVRAIKPDGNYVDSPELRAAPRVPFGCIGLLNGDSWHLLKLTSGKDYLSRTQQAATGGFIQYYGRRAPVYAGGGEAVQDILTANYIVTGVDVSALTAMLGKEVVYKDFKGNLIKGVFTSLPQQQRGQKTTVTISITGTDTEAVEYDPV